MSDCFMGEICNKYYWEISQQLTEHEDDVILGTFMKQLKRHLPGIRGMDDVTMSNLAVKFLGGIANAYENENDFIPAVVETLKECGLVALASQMEREPCYQRNGSEEVIELNNRGDQNREIGEVENNVGVEPTESRRRKIFLGIVFVSLVFGFASSVALLGVGIASETKDHCGELITYGAFPAMAISSLPAGFAIVTQYLNFDYLNFGRMWRGGKLGVAIAVVIGLNALVGGIALMEEEVCLQEK